jgi:hypothetical protein
LGCPVGASRSLSAGILDGGSGEISLGGSRLNRFMKDVENVTGHMGEGEAVTPAEEVKSGVAADDAALVEIADADGAAEVTAARTGGSAAQLRGCRSCCERTARCSLAAVGLSFAGVPG